MNKRGLSIVLSVCILLSLIPALPITVSAETEDIYTYTIANGEATITGCDTSASGEIEIPATLDGYPVTSIGAWAFSGCYRLTSITVPESVISIEHYAFNNCNRLKSIIIPEGVKSIAYYAFYACSSLTSITIPESVTSIGDGLFNRCSNLVEINVVAENEYYSSVDGILFDKNKTKIIQYAAGNKRTTYEIPDGITSIEEWAFYRCSSLENITIPKSVETIGMYAFYGCNNLISISIPEGVTTIDSYAFSGCSSLTSITIPESVTSIKDSAFDSCSALTSITIPKGVTSIGWGLFSDCGSLGSINVDSENEYYSSANGNLFDKNKTRLIQYAVGNERTTYKIPEGVISIGEEAFYRCSNLTSITIPDSVTNIERATFYGCIGLTSITIPKGVTNIVTAAFNRCSNLAEIDVVTENQYYSSIDGNLFDKNKTKLIKHAEGNERTTYEIPEGVIKIESYSFSDCDNLTSIIIPDSVDEIGSYAFSDCGGLTSITIPKNVTTIGSYGFARAENLKDVYYGGSEEDWDKISIDLGNNPLTDATIHYAKEETPSIFTYTVAKGEATITGCDTSASGEIEIPATLDGYPVTSVGNRAFYGCSSLTSVTIPKGVTKLGDGVFSNCFGLVSINVDSENEYYSSVDGNLFDKNKAKFIQYAAGNKSITYEIPESVKSIGSSAFYGCTSLTSITISKGVTSIGTSAFSRCSSLDKIEVDSENGYYSSMDGNLFDENKTKLIQYAPGNERTAYEIPDSVTSIGMYALFGCNNLTSIIIPEGVEEIGSYAFSACISLTSITIPKSVETIGSNAFYGFKNLTDVYYTGSADDWKSINIYQNNDVLTNATIHYNVVVITGFTAEKSGTNVNASISISNIPSDAIVYVASYNGSGKMLEVKQLTITDGSGEESFSSKEVFNLKAFVLDKNIFPLTTMKETKLQ